MSVLSGNIALNIDKEEWRYSDFDHEYQYCKIILYSFLVNQRGDREVLVDLGHHNLYFAQAFIKYLFKETNETFLFVRIRRDRYETALSLTYKYPGRLL
jgi:hypothetical protein